MTAERLGEIAALGTAVLWSFTYIQFTIAVRSIGPKKLNRLRLLAALVLLVVAHWVAFGSPIPRHAELSRWGWLTLSGVVGFAISDAMLFRALLYLGAHRTSLLTSLIPVASALLAWASFGERMSGLEIVGGAVTVLGVAVVVSARSGGEAVRRKTGLGVVLALGAVVAQSLRYVLSKQGMAGGFPVLSTNVIQILAATLVIWLWAAVRNQWRGNSTVFGDRKTLLATVGGSVTGPFLGVTLSLVALANAPVAVASTLMALVPVFLLPLGRIVFKERITTRAAVGTLLAVVGVAILMLV